MYYKCYFIVKFLNEQSLLKSTLEEKYFDETEMDEALQFITPNE